MSVGHRVMRLVLSVSVLVLVGCGGGGSSGCSGMDGTVPVVQSPGATERALSEGLHSYFVRHDFEGKVLEAFISRTKFRSAPNRIEDDVVASLKGAVLQTLPSPFDGFVYDETYYTLDGSRSYSAFDWRPQFMRQSDAQPEDDYLLIQNDPLPSNPPLGSGEFGWRLTLRAENIAGKKVVDYMLREDGSPVPPEKLGFVNLEQTFGEGAVAYYADYVASRDMVKRRESFSGIIVNRNDVISNMGFCWRSPASPKRLGIALKPNQVLALYDTTDGDCDWSSLTPIAVGSWTQASTAAGTLYSLQYPVEVTAGAWADMFADVPMPAMRIVDRVIVFSNTLIIYYAALIPAGTRFEGRRAFFNEAAVSALKAASGLK